MCTFAIKRQRKNVIRVRSRNSINSARLYITEIMIKMSITITLILTARIILDFNCFQMSLLICKKQCRSLSRKHKHQKRSTKKFTFCRKKLDVKNTKFQLRLLQSQY